MPGTTEEKIQQLRGLPASTSGNTPATPGFDVNWENGIKVSVSTIVQGGNFGLPLFIDRDNLSGPIQIAIPAAEVTAITAGSGTHTVLVNNIVVLIFNVVGPNLVSNIPAGTSGAIVVVDTDEELLPGTYTLTYTLTSGAVTRTITAVIEVLQNIEG